MILLYPKPGFLQVLGETSADVSSQQLMTGGVIVVLVFFALVAFIVWTVRTHPRPGRVIAAITVLVGALPPVLYALVALVAAMKGAA